MTLKMKYRFIKKVGFVHWIVNLIFTMCRRDRFWKFSLHFTSQCIMPKNIFLSENDFLTRVSLAVSGNCYFQANNKIYLGRNVLIAPGVKIISSNHRKDDKSIEAASPIIIGDDVWIGANVVILPNVEIAKGVIIAAGSIVTKSVLEPNAVVKGAPAK